MLECFPPMYVQGTTAWFRISIIGLHDENRGDLQHSQNCSLKEL